MFEVRNETEIWYKAKEMPDWIHYGSAVVAEPIEKEKFAVCFRCQCCGTIAWIKGKDMKIEEKFIDRKFMDGSYVWICPVCKFGMESISFAPVENIFNE